MYYYLLDENKKPYKVTLTEFLQYISSAKDDDFKYVKKDIIGDVYVSTVFLCIDHGFSTNENALPVLWETMIFGGKYDQYQERYTSHEDALAGHEIALKLVKDSLAN